MLECAVCGIEATKKCSRCKTAVYCSAEHQRQDWKRHKVTCQDIYQSNQYELHKREFDRIVKAYGLDSDQASTEISEFVTQGEAVTPLSFSEKFGTTPAEAVVFLEWIKVGVKFKEEAIDAAKKSGIGSST